MYEISQNRDKLESGIKHEYYALIQIKYHFGFVHMTIDLFTMEYLFQ